MMLKFSQKYICNDKQISFKAENQINRQSWAFRLLKKEMEPFFVDRYLHCMFNSLLCTFLKIFQGCFAVKCRSMKDENNSPQG